MAGASDGKLFYKVEHWIVGMELDFRQWNLKRWVDHPMAVSRTSCVGVVKDLFLLG